MAVFIEPSRYRCPEEFEVSKTFIRRVLIVGSCLAERWVLGVKQLSEPFPSDLFLFGTPLPTKPPHQIEDYDFQIVQLPLRSAVPDTMFVSLSYADIDGHRKMFQDAVSNMKSQLAQAMTWNSRCGLLTFVFNYAVPQQNPDGRLLPRYDLRNFVYFVEKLNEALTEELQRYKNAYLFDFNEVVANHGRRFFQDDSVWRTNHGAELTGFDVEFDKNRLETPSSVHELFELRIDEFITSGWNEIVAMYRTIRQSDTIKMVVFDLDDTLWRGVLGELTSGDLPTSEGWPIGLWEALSFLRRRGVLLAIISKNEELIVLKSWDRIFSGTLQQKDFAIRRINWATKTENMEEILRALNLLSRNVLYVDDNPAERAAMKAAFPEIRVLGGSPLTWRRLLLWAPELQVSAITPESARRSDMVLAQVTREEQRLNLSREEFLAGLKVEVALFPIDSVDHPRFSRAFELLNKTNQFNTTGRRWTREECAAHMRANAGPSFFAFEVKDVFTNYGLVIVAIVQGGQIMQLVMSCRILGLEAELAAVATVVSTLRSRGHSAVTAALVETKRNLPARELYRQCGFVNEANGLWLAAPNTGVTVPSHVKLREVVQAEFR
jgi:FkbH-like protein